MEQLRPAGSGRQADAASLLRSAEPRAVLVIASTESLPSDWPATATGIDANLGHALGWTCEVRDGDIVVLNPLGEGWLRGSRPEFGEDWRSNVKRTESCALFVVPPSDDGPVAALAAAEAEGRLKGVTIRTAVAEKAAPSVGRNQPCPCGSGKKYKHCCG